MLSVRKRETEFNPHTIIIPPGRCPSASPGGILFFLLPPRTGRIRRICWWILGARQKPQKPLAVDARCLLRAIDAAAARKSLKQAWIFSATHIITPQGSCIHRKAINRDKPQSCGVLLHQQGKTVYPCLSPWRGW